MRTTCFLLFIWIYVGCKQVSIPEDVSAIMADLPQEVDYNLHVKKILSDKCFSCHGPDAKKQKAGLRLDVADEAYTKQPNPV